MTTTRPPTATGRTGAAAPATRQRPTGRRPLTAAIAVVLVAVTAVAAVPAGAEPPDATAPPGAPMPATQPHADDGRDHGSGPERCDLRDPSRSEHDEWAHCLVVDATLSAAPGDGEAATLSYEVRSATRRAEAEVAVELPAGLEFIEPPAGAELSTGLADPVRGSVTVASSRRDLSPHRAHRGAASVRAVGDGPVEIVVRVSAARPDGGVDAAADRVFLTLGGAAGTSAFGIETPSAIPTVPAPEPVVEAGLLGVAAHRDAPIEGGPSAPAPDALTSICTSGTWTYTDIGGVSRPAANVAVDAWDVDAGPRDRMAWGTTGPDGRFNLCYDNGDYDEGGLVDPVITFTAANLRWRIRVDRASNTNYVFEVPVGTDQSASVNLGARQPIPTYTRVLRAYDAVNRFWSWTPNACWDPNDTSSACRAIVVNWSPTSTDGTYYSTAFDDVHLAAADPDAMHTVIHEATHAVTDDVYDDAYPDISGCSGHDVHIPSGPGCAWTEGFAEWVPASVLGDPYYRWPDGRSIALETPTWDSPGWGVGPTTEGRVAGAMIDIEDATNEAAWDRSTEGSGTARPQWATFVSGAAPTFAAHLQERQQKGYPLSEPVLASIFHNTMDFGYHETLGTYGHLLRPSPWSYPHDYRYAATSSSWSAIAVRPNTIVDDVDLTVFGGPNQVDFMTQSRSGAGVVEHVVVDSHVWPPREYFPEISGRGAYFIELAQGVDTLEDGSRQWNMGTGDVVHVRDTLLEANVATYFRVVPSTATQDAELFLHTRSGASTSPIQARVWAAAAASNSGAGGAESTQYTSAVVQTAGLVLINRSGEGTYTIHRDTTPPSGSVVIDGGAASTSSTTVTLALAGTDAQTGIDGVQISLDGAIDTEPVQAMAATRTVTLPAGAGTKTVLVRFHNRAGMLSQDAVDTITLTTGTARPDLRVTALANPPTTRADGAGFTATDTTANRGTATAAATTTRYHLSKDTAKGAGDVLLTGQRAISELPAGASRSGSRSVTIPAGTAAGTYHLIACADDRAVVTESNETNNCRASTATIRVT